MSTKTTDSAIALQQYDTNEHENIYFNFIYDSYHIVRIKTYKIFVF